LTSSSRAQLRPCPCGLRVQYISVKAGSFLQQPECGRVLLPASTARHSPFASAAHRRPRRVQSSPRYQLATCVQVQLGLLSNKIWSIAQLVRSFYSSMRSLVRILSEANSLIILSYFLVQLTCGLTCGSRPCPVSATPLLGPAGQRPVWVSIGEKSHSEFSVYKKIAANMQILHKLYLLNRNSK
jgi:hypothetical protein